MLNSRSKKLTEQWRKDQPRLLAMVPRLSAGEIEKREKEYQARKTLEAGQKFSLNADIILQIRSEFYETIDPVLVKNGLSIIQRQTAHKNYVIQQLKKRSVT